MYMLMELVVANVVDGSVNLNESVFTKGSGEYAIGIASSKRK